MRKIVVMDLGYSPIVDLHAHLRNGGYAGQSKWNLMRASEGGIDTLVYMPNTEPCLDNREAIEEYHEWLLCIVGRTKPLPTCAITVGREGKTPVDIEAVRDLVVGFTDDGSCLEDLDIFEQGLRQGVLMMMHCEPETEMVQKYLGVLSKVDGGKLHIQHVSLASTVRVIREAKKSGLQFTAETCPHYFMYDSTAEDHPVNPPLGSPGDVDEIRFGLANGDIDAIATDYAPLPRPKGTGFASFRNFVPSCNGLVLDGTITAERLKELIHTNPLRIIASGNPALLR